MLKTFSSPAFRRCLQKMWAVRFLSILDCLFDPSLKDKTEFKYL